MPKSGLAVPKYPIQKRAVFLKDAYLLYFCLDCIGEIFLLVIFFSDDSRDVCQVLPRSRRIRADFKTHQTAVGEAMVARAA